MSNYIVVVSHCVVRQRNCGLSTVLLLFIIVHLYYGMKGGWVYWIFLVPLINSIVGGWSPHVVDELCPRFVHMGHVTTGFGDQLDRYIMHLHLAQLLNATLVTSGFTVGPTFHSGSDEYRSVAMMLGISFDINEQQISAYNLTTHSLVYSHIAYSTTVKALPCHVIIQSRMNGCDTSPPYAWCSTYPKYRAITATAAYRNTVQLHLCPKPTPRLRRRQAAVKLVWHVRSGDICLRCGDNASDITYYTSLLMLITSSLLRTQHLHVTFISQDELPLLRPHFPSAFFAINASLLDTACMIQRSDILITSGSSFAPLIAAFRPQDRKSVV